MFRDKPHNSSFIKTLLYKKNKLKTRRYYEIWFYKKRRKKKEEWIENDNYPIL